MGADGLLVAYAWPILQPGLEGSATAILSVLTVTLWVAFAVDYVVRVSHAERRWSFVAHHLPDLAMLLLPVLRPLRALRALMALTRVNRGASMWFRGRAVVYICGGLQVGVSSRMSTTAMVATVNIVEVTEEIAAAAGDRVNPTWTHKDGCSWPHVTLFANALSAA